MEPSPPTESPVTAWADAYPTEAFDFVQNGVEYTVTRAHGENVHHVADEMSPNRHVDGRQLSEGLRDLAIRRFGLLACEVLRSWNIHRTDDFGRIVYAMIEGQELHKSDDDRLEDFFSVFDFEEAFSDDSIRDELTRIRDDERVRG